MELPLELVTPDGDLTLQPTADHSSTRLLLETWGRKPQAHLVALELNETDVRELAGALLQWLADSGHALPVVNLEDEDAAVTVLPEHTR